MMISIGHQAPRHFRTCRKGLYHVDAVGERTDVESNRSHRYYFMVTLIPDLRLRDLALGRQKKPCDFTTCESNLKSLAVVLSIFGPLCNFKWGSSQVRLG